MEDQMAQVRAKRKKKISPFNQSPYREDYVRLIKAGWSSTSLERYAAYRYDEKIPASTFRNHMRRIEKPETPAITGKDGRAFTEAEIDVLQIRQNLIQLQLQRLSVDVQHEFQMNKLFGSTRAEIDLLGRLLNEAKQDQRDFGVIAHDPADALPDVPVESASNAPRFQTVGQMLGLGEGQDPLAVVQQLAQILPIAGKGAQSA